MSQTTFKIKARYMSNDNLYRWVKASESPKTEGYYVCSVNNGFICSVYFNLKNGWFFNSSYAFQGQVKEWLEKIEADQDAVKKLVNIIINSPDYPSMAVNIENNYFLIPKQ